MAVKLSREAVLREIVLTLVKGWGAKAVSEALDEIVVHSTYDHVTLKASNSRKREQTAMDMVSKLPLVGERKSLMHQLAQAFDEGKAFPTMKDVRAFLSSHNQRVKELRSRRHAFELIFPLLLDMSDKGLIKVISYARYSGPAELEAISDAIRGAGATRRVAGSDSDNS